MKKGRVFNFENTPHVIQWSSVVGPIEGKGPLGAGFDMVLDSELCGKDSWEEAESALQKISLGVLLDKAHIKDTDVDVIYAGDLLNQCMGSGFSIRSYDIPFCGIYGACSTSVLSMIQAAVAVNSGLVDLAISSTSSHFCSAEKQFRYPLEYGGQRPPTAQRTVTGAGSALISASSDKPCPQIEKAIIGKIFDKGIKDANNMGAAMAPAAADTIATFFSETGTVAEDYDLIMTGDLGLVGSELLYELLESEYGYNIRGKHNDSGIMMYNIDEQDIHSGGSGCGCCGTVMCSKILGELNEGKLHKVLVVATGALLSTISAFQGESIPGIAHGVLLTDGRG